MPMSRHSHYPWEDQRKPPLVGLPPDEVKTLGQLGDTTLVQDYIVAPKLLNYR